MKWRANSHSGSQHNMWRFITMVTRARHFTLSWARRIQSTLLHPNPLRAIIMLSFHTLRLSNCGKAKFSCISKHRSLLTVSFCALMLSSRKRRNPTFRQSCVAIAECYNWIAEENQFLGLRSLFTQSQSIRLLFGRGGGPCKGQCVLKSDIAATLQTKNVGNCSYSQTGHGAAHLHDNSWITGCMYAELQTEFMSKYSVFHLKRNPNYYTWTPSRTKPRNQWQYWILAAVSRCCSRCTAWNMYCRNFSCFVARWALVTDKNFLWPEILLPVGVLLSYWALPCVDTHC
jgi:hypothetical protein